MLSFFWDLFKWLHDDVRVAIKAEAIGPTTPEAVHFEICNRGDKPTSIMHVMLVVHSPNWLHRCLGQWESVTYLSRVAPKQFALPHLLSPGEAWTATYEFIDEDRAISNSDNYPKLIAENRLFYYVRFSHSSKIHKARVTPQKTFSM